ncbi:MAG: PAS domain S-box protein [Candidatus Methanoperedens sp.]|nr:PAS domain S-box protein [Candidatus Methanoperedens sp.]
MNERSHKELLLEIENLHAQLAEAKETLAAIRSGEVDAIVVSGKKGEQVFTLEGAEQPYRILIEEMMEGAVMLASDDTILYCNSSFAGMLKTPLEKLIGTRITNYIEPADEAVFRKLLIQGRKQGTPGEITMLARDRTSVPTHLSLNTLWMDDFQLVYLVTTDLTEQKRIQDELRRARDELEKRVEERTVELVKSNMTLQAEIIERKQIEKALKESKDNYRTLADSISDPFFALNKDFRFTYWNHAAEKDTGISTNSIIGKYFFDVFPELKGTQVEREYKEAIATGKTRFLENHRNRQGGAVTYHDLSVYPTANGIEVFSRDVTERKRVEEALRKAHDELELRVQDRTARLKESLEEKEILLREIHHRVKNNMQVIYGLLILQEEFSNNEKISEMIKESQNRITSMALIHEKLYRSESLSKIYYKEYIDDLVSGLFESYGFTEDKIGLKVNAENISMEIDTAIPVGLIINELVSNSLKHAFPEGKKGEIEISLSSIGEYMIELLVKDNGVGIPHDVDFRNTESLGLHIVNILVENQLHGEISMNNDNGTEFRIRFRRMK